MHKCSLKSEDTHHITLPCLVLTWRCRSGHPKQATSQFLSGQLYRNNKTVSSKISPLSYLIPRLSSFWEKSASVKSSKRLAWSSVKITKLDSVCRSTQLLAPSQLTEWGTKQKHIPDSVHKLCSYTMLSTATRKYDRSGGCKVRRRYAQPSKHR